MDSLDTTGVLGSGDAVGDLSIGSIWNTSATAQQNPGLGNLSGPGTIQTSAVTAGQAATDPSASGAYGAFVGLLGKVAGTVTSTELSRYQAGRALAPGKAGGAVDTTAATAAMQAKQAAQQRLLMIVAGVAVLGFVAYRLAK